MMRNEPRPADRVAWFFEEAMELIGVAQAGEATTETLSGELRVVTGLTPTLRSLGDLRLRGEGNVHVGRGLTASREVNPPRTCQVQTTRYFFFFPPFFFVPFFLAALRFMVPNHLLGIFLLGVGLPVLAGTSLAVPVGHSEPALSGLTRFSGSNRAM
jgi:hypothetical protein